MQQWRPEKFGVSFDDVYMERSKGFVKVLQELKNLRPQLYSAAEYCEKSYLHNEQKQMVLDNLKDYVVRAFVNAVDHLGTVAYKMTDLFEQQTLEISTLELNVSRLNQQLLTCQSYYNSEGLRQQQMLATTAKHHKHYILPNSVTIRAETTSNLHQDGNQSHVHSKSYAHTSGMPAFKTLSWHLASDSNSESNEAHGSRTGDSKISKVTSDIFHLLEAEEPSTSTSLASHLQAASGNRSCDVLSHTFGTKETFKALKPISAPKSIDNPGRLQVYRPPVRSKSMISAFFAQNKTFKPKKVLVS